MACAPERFLTQWVLECDPTADHDLFEPVAGFLFRDRSSSVLASVHRQGERISQCEEAPRSKNLFALHSPEMLFLVMACVNYSRTFLDLAVADGL